MLPVLTPPTGYLPTDNLARSRATAAAGPTVRRGTSHYPANIGKVTSIENFVNNYQLLSGARKAFGLSGVNYAKRPIAKLGKPGVRESKRGTNMSCAFRVRAFAEVASMNSAAKSDRRVHLGFYFGHKLPADATDCDLLSGPVLSKGICRQSWPCSSPPPTQRHGASVNRRGSDSAVIRSRRPNIKQSLKKYFELDSPYGSGKVQRLVGRLSHLFVNRQGLRLSRV
jgi:hypothetical protein